MKWAVAAVSVAVVCVFVLAGVAVLAAGAPGCGQAGPGPSAEALSEIPGDYLAGYVAAATRYGVDWSVLAGVGSIETDHGRLEAPGVRSGTNFAGAAGPMQFLLSTWRAYGVDGDRDGDRDVYDARDAIPGAANYLKASGAPGDWRRALFAYNHANWYVDDVLGRAARYRAAVRREALALAPSPPAVAVTSESAAAPDVANPLNLGGCDGGVADLPVGGGEAIAGGRFFPVPRETRVVGRFGEPRPGHLHAGIDFAAPDGTAIVAIDDGRVSLVQGTASSGGYGNYVCVDHGAYESCSAHMQDGSVSVRVGQVVRGGQPIGREGNTGRSFGAHLHFEIRRPGHGTPVCPAPYLGLPASVCVRSSL